MSRGTRPHRRRGGDREPGRPQRVRRLRGHLPRLGRDLPEARLGEAAAAGGRPAVLLQAGVAAGQDAAPAGKRSERGGRDDRRPALRRHGRDPEDAPADRRGGRHVHPRVRLLSRLLPGARDVLHRPVRPEPSRALPLPVVRRRVRPAEPARVPPRVARASRLRDRAHRQVPERLRQGAAADVPNGWTEWYGLVDHSTYRMWGYNIYENGRRRDLRNGPPRGAALYQTDVSPRRPSTSSAAAPRATRRSSSPSPTSRPTTSPADAGHDREARAPGAAASRRVRASRSRSRRLQRERPRRQAVVHRTLEPADQRAREAAITKRMRERWASLLAVDDGVEAIIDALAAPASSTTPT